MASTSSRAQSGSFPLSTVSATTTKVRTSPTTPSMTRARSSERDRQTRPVAMAPACPRWVVPVPPDGRVGAKWGPRSREGGDLAPQTPDPGPWRLNAWTTRGSTTRALGRATGGAAALAVLALAAGCSSTATPSGGSTAAAPAATGSASTSAAKACVPDPLAVANTKPSATTTDKLPADLVTKLDTAAKAGFAEAATPGAIVAVRTPKGTWTQAYGQADPKTKAPMTTDMHIRIGSLTKMYTDDGHAQIEAGKVSLDDPISKYVPGIPNGDKVTLRLLGIMHSGVASYSMNQEFTDAVRPPGDGGLHARPADRVRRRQVTGLPAGREVRLLQHQHGAAREGDREGHRQAPAQLHKDQLFTRSA